MSEKAFPSYAEELVRRALEEGAVSAKPFDIADICFDSRVLMKCMYGCPDWGKGLTCPSRPGNPSMAEWREMLERYKWGIVIHAHDKMTTQRVSFLLEGEAFRKGYYFAFSMSDCGLCKQCAGYAGGQCRNVHKARPAFHSVGIDVFKTVRQMGFEINTLADQDTEEQNWYAALWVE